MAQPTCGHRTDIVKSDWDKIWAVLRIIGLISIPISIYSVAANAKKVGFVIWELVFWGMPFAWAAIVVAVTVYVVAVWTLYRLWKTDCLDTQPGQSRCFSGVVEKIYDEHTSVLMFVNPEHPHLDLVTRSHPAYWGVINQGDYVYCSSGGSPVVKVFYKSSRICSVRSGSMVGGAVLGLGGIVAAAAAAAAIGCASVVLCVVALVVAALIVLAAVLVGAIAGGGVASAISDSSVPAGKDGEPISVGDYISVQGPAHRRPNNRGAVVQYFNDETVMLGRSGAAPPFTHADPDTAIPEALDGCPIS